MATQTLIFKATPNCDSVTLFEPGSDTVVATGASVVMGSNRKAIGSCTVTDIPAGLYEVICFAGTVPVWVQYVDLLLADGTYHCRETIEADVRTSSRAAPGDEMALADNAITASKYDETTAYPLKSADTGSTAIARTGADGDTLETLSDQLDTAQSDLDLITGADGATLATTQGNYAPAKAGAKMDLVDAPNATAVTAIKSGLSTFDHSSDKVTVAVNEDKTDYVLSTAPPTKEEIAAEVRTELTDELAHLDADVSSRAEPGDEMDIVSVPNATAISAIQDGIATSTEVSAVEDKVDAISVPTASDNATAVWSFPGGRTLSSFGTLVADIVSAIWSGAERTLTAFTHKVTVSTNEDKSGYALETAPPTKEQIASQVRTELTTELGRLDQPVSSRLSPTTAGRTLNVEADGTIAVTAEVAEESIRNAVGLSDGKRVATPEDVNITIGSVQATVNDRGEGFQIRQFVGEVFPCVVLGVTDGAGPVDLSGYEDLRLILQDRCGADVQVVEHDAITVFGDNSDSFSWVPNEALVSTARRIEGALWEYKDGEQFKVIITGSITIEDCPRKDNT